MNTTPLPDPLKIKETTAQLMKRHKEWKAKKGINGMQ